MAKIKTILGIIGVAIIVALIVFSPAPPEEATPNLVNREVGEVVLPIDWGNLGAQLVEAGVIDGARFEELYQARGGLSAEGRALLSGNNNDQVLINEENAGLLLNLFWAFGLANKNEILETGPMTDPRYGGDPARFASTGGWSLAAGDPMDHYSRHAFVVLSEEEQARVERVAQGIYRPCCGNSTYFPDCNHGMAMLGLLELMAAKGASEEEMYQVALAVNALWFPETYRTLAAYFEHQGIAWSEVDPRLILGADYSSGSGYQRILEEIEPVRVQGGGGCSV